MRNRARKRNLYSAVAILLLVAGSVGLMAGAEARQPTGTVVLTVAGDLVQTNRAPYDSAVDVFLGYHERSFDRAFEFDRAMLEGLGAVELEIDYKDWHDPIVFSGPRLSDVLRAAGCAGGPVTTLALDGFATEISPATLAAHEWVLATSADGRPHAIGGRGPLWLVFDPPGDRPATEEEELMWPWALFFIQCG